MTIDKVFIFINLYPEWVPQVTVWTSIIAGFSLTGFLLLFSHAPFKLPLILPRYSAVIGAGLCIWIVLLWCMGAFPLHGIEDGLDLVAGGLIFFSAIFCNYYLSNISAGFRIEMLINLTGDNKEVNLDKWMSLYGKGQGMELFLENRLNATLLPWKLVVCNDNQITLTSFGHFVAQIAKILSTVFSET